MTILEHIMSRSSKYDCKIVKQNVDEHETLDDELSRNSYIVKYNCDEKICYDISKSTRCVFKPKIMAINLTMHALIGRTLSF